MYHLLSCWFPGAIVLTFIPGVKYRYFYRFLGGRKSDCASVSQKQWNMSPKIHVYAIHFVFYLLFLYCQSSDQPFMAVDTVVHLSGQCLHVQSFYELATASKIVSMHGMVWPVEKWLNVTPKAHTIFLSRYIYMKPVLVLIQSLMNLSYCVPTYILILCLPLSAVVSIISKIWWHFRRIIISHYLASQFHRLEWTSPSVSN